jgi:hypothetical protein
MDVGRLGRMLWHTAHRRCKHGGRKNFGCEGLRFKEGDMVVKQASIQTCVCGQAIHFPEGEIRTDCSCGAVWECGEEGYWYAEMPSIPFESITAKSKPKDQPNRYARYMARRNKAKRKAGRR